MVWNDGIDPTAGAGFEHAFPLNDGFWQCLVGF